MNVGIIGLGRIGCVHLKAISQLKELNVVTVSDVNEDTCKRISSEYNIPYYTDFNRLMTDKTIDAIWVCSPSNLHDIHVSEALKNNKYVFCEKPLETDVDKIKKLIDTFPNIDKRLMIGFNRRFDPDFSYAKQQMKTIVGKPTIVKIISRDPSPPPLEYIKTSGGLYRDMTIHDLDMARFITDDEVVSVYATGTVNYSPEIEGIDIDTALITLIFKSGIICNIDNSRVSSYGYDQRLEIHGENGMIQVGNHKTHQCNFYTQKSIETSVLEDFFLQRYKEAYARECLHFSECIKSGIPFSVTAKDALKSLQLANACKTSLDKKTVVTL